MSTPGSGIEPLKERLKATWMAGDFGRLAKVLEGCAEEFVDRLALTPGSRVLDVACGSGNLAIPAARAGASVTGVDIATNLIEQARERAKSEGLAIQFDEGDAEQLPYDDGSFDDVVTMFGAMFAPRPDLAASELVRVCKSGGRIAMANWTPSGFAGQMFKIHAKHVAPPPNMPSPVKWGEDETVRERLREGIADLQLARRTCVFRFPFAPAEAVEFFRTYFGPSKNAFAALDADGQAALRGDLEQLWSQHNKATDNTTSVDSEYLEVIAVRS
jgi:2-polyprenyl-3-methyl-5-hydroxy-6-metoxy-1,4-benzoquinol methylase